MRQHAHALSTAHSKPRGLMAPRWSGGSCAQIRSCSVGQPTADVTHSASGASGVSSSSVLPAFFSGFSRASTSASAFRNFFACMPLLVFHFPVYLGGCGLKSRSFRAMAGPAGKRRASRCHPTPWTPATAGLIRPPPHCSRVGQNDNCHAPLSVAETLLPAVTISLALTSSVVGAGIAAWPRFHLIQPLQPVAR